MVENKSNLDAVGSRFVVPRVMSLATVEDRARILHALLNVQGEGKQRVWARATHRYSGDRTKASAFELAYIERLSSLHVAASHGAVRSTRLLLAAGADETMLDPAGQPPSGVIGVTMPPGAKDRNKKCEAVNRA